ncbi:protein of unknown function [Taphrina deformans PYCC 5710]|uniref:Uncharacterized protein n=1 Tax=Taphrina deformans (strain PYCC 5710 / ATCC 11124 / CBS 356.35 / IMI 108563 / JCM 9778 / NBRC 8474) TaxID=1097556 RepID=R4XCW0_TAPDE|nr:protein of unknown function [Taphrina deformans PYCC 5710]|eukprot:CCG82248.1 protein of unknown function [Taphrina deformans PYCC 5710]
MSSTQSLRYVASLQLHRLDHLVSLFHRQRTDLCDSLSKLITAEGQLEVMEARQKSSIERNGSMSIGLRRALESLMTRQGSLKTQVEDTLEEMNAISSNVNQLYATIASDLGNIDTNSELAEYSRASEASTFNYEYRELQRAVDIIGEQAKLLSSEIRVKILQYNNCPVVEHKRLLTAWSSLPAGKDQEMDDLASMMLS